MTITLDNTGSGELYIKVLKSICGDTSEKSMVDLGCFEAPHTPLLGFKERTYVDIQDRPLLNKEEQKYFVNDDIIKFLERGRYYDVSISSDSLEHLTLEQGRLMISLMERYSEKQIIFTPLGDYMVTPEEHPDRHRSGWYPEYFEGWAKIVMPRFHPTLGENGTGAFFVFHCDNIKEEFERVKNELA